MIHPPPTSTKAAFGAGCFWGVERAFMQHHGVRTTEVGYMGGHKLSPTYKEVCQGSTGHAEAVLVHFDPETTSYNALLTLFWQIHDPTQLNRQGYDVGSQYRSIIFYYDAHQEEQAKQSLAEHQKTLSNSIVTTIELARDFWRAEEYHQKYLLKRG